MRLIRSDAGRGLALRDSARFWAATSRCAFSRERAACLSCALTAALERRAAFFCCLVCAWDCESVASARWRLACSMRRSEPGRDRWLRKTGVGLGVAWSSANAPWLRQASEIPMAMSFMILPGNNEHRTCQHRRDLRQTGRPRAPSPVERRSRDARLRGEEKDGGSENEEATRCGISLPK